jgi:hypothetical protein
MNSDICQNAQPEMRSGCSKERCDMIRARPMSIQNSFTDTISIAYSCLVHCPMMAQSRIRTIVIQTMRFLNGTYRMGLHMMGSPELREWEVLENYYYRPNDAVSNAQRFGEKMLHYCLALPIPRVHASANSHELVIGTALFSQYHSENGFPDSCISVRWEEVPVASVERK